MFVSLLSPAQQRTLGQAIHAVASTDGEIHDLEAQFLDALRREGGALLEVDLDGPALDLPSLEAAAAAAFADEPASSPARRAFVAEVAGMVTIDGESMAGELEILEGLMNAVEVALAESAVFLAFGRKAGDLAREGTELVLGNPETIA